MYVNTYRLSIIIILLLINHNGWSQNWTLQQCIDTALANNIQVKILENEKKISDLKNKEVKSNLIPKIYANGEYKYFIDLPYQLMPASIFGGPQGVYKEAQFGVPHNINGNLTIQIPIYNANLYGGIQKTSIAKGMVDVQVKKTKEQIYYEVTALYRNAQLLMNKNIFIDSSMYNTEEMLSNLKMLHEQSLITGTDIKRVQYQLSILNSQKVLVISKTAQVIDALKMYMNLPLDADLKISSTIDLTDNFGQQIYETKPSSEEELIKFKKEMVNSEISTLQKSRYLPTVGAYGYLGIQGYGYDGEPNSFLNFYPMNIVGIKVSMPLFNGTVTTKQISQKKLEYQNIELQQKAINDKTQLEINNAVKDLQVALRMLDVRLNQIALAKDIYKEVNNQHKQGLASTTDLIKADNELRLANQNYLSSITDCIIADLKVRKVTGNILNN
jgi:OMF family outer membrane factor